MLRTCCQCPQSTPPIPFQPHPPLYCSSHPHPSQSLTSQFIVLQRRQSCLFFPSLTLSGLGRLSSAFILFDTSIVIRLNLGTVYPTSPSYSRPLRRYTPPSNPQIVARARTVPQTKSPEPSSSSNPRDPWLVAYALQLWLPPVVARP